MMKASGEQPDRPLERLLEEISPAIAGVRVSYSGARLAEILSPRHFVDVRSTEGGPAPPETDRALGTSRAVLGQDRTWLHGSRKALADAQAELTERARAL